MGFNSTVSAKTVKAIASVTVDYIIEPVAEGITEKFTLTTSWTMLKYQLYAGDTPLTDNIIDDGEPTITAAGGFEGSNITIRIYSNSDELFRAKLNTVKIGKIKVGRLIRI